MLDIEAEDVSPPYPPAASRNPRVHRFFSSPAGSEFIGIKGNNAYDPFNKHQSESSTIIDSQERDQVPSKNSGHIHSTVPNGVDEQDHLDEYLFSNNGEDDAETDAITLLQREHEAYIEVLEATHAQEMQAIKIQLEDLKLAQQNSSKNQELQREVEHSLATIRDEVEGLVRAEAAEERRKEKEIMEAQFKESMAKELEIISQAIKDEAQVQMQAQLQNMREEIEAQVRSSLQSETEHKARLALIQQMRPQVRAELEQALRLEIRTVYSQEIRKEVESSIVPEVEKRIAAEYKAKYARTQSAQKEQVEAELQTQLAASRKSLEERVRRDAEATIARKVAKKVEGEVRVRVEKMKHEVRAECEAEAQKLVEASLAQIKQERAEIARLRAVENVRRSREEAAHKEAEAEFHKRVAEFKRYMQEEENRIARMKAVMQWRDEHPRRTSPNNTSTTSNPHPSSIPTSHTFTPSHSTNHLTPTSSSPNSSSTSMFSGVPKSKTRTSSTHTPPPTTPMVSTAIPAITTPSASNSPPALSASPKSPTPPSFPSPNPPQPPVKPPNKSGLAFDFTFDVKLIAAKLISDAREQTHTHDAIKHQGELERKSVEFSNHHIPSPNLTTSSSPIIPRSQAPTPIKTTSSPSSTPPPVRSQSPAPPAVAHTLGPISTEQRAQREFETQPPIVPPQGALGARLRVLLPRLYQLWDECEISHIHRLDFSNGLRAVDVAQAERRVAMEIARMRRVLPTIHKEMAMVARREAIKARLAEESQGREIPHAEKSSLLAELRRVTGAAQVAISAWEAANNQPFMYRGFPYLALMSGVAP